MKNKTIIYKNCIIEKINNEYQTSDYNIGRYSALKDIKRIINKVLKFRELIK